MKYSLWHCGVLMGNAHMRKSAERPRQVYGPFRPTAYGRTLLPQLTGVLSAGAALKQELSAKGMSEDSLADASAVEDFLETSPAGQRMLDVGRIIADIELRDPAGVAAPFETIGFLDLAGLRSWSGHPSAPVPGGLASGDSHVLVSATLANRSSGRMSQRIAIT